MRHYTDDPVRDMEMEYAERVSIIGTCPFCLEWVTASDGILRAGNGDVAHRECVEKMEREVERFE